MLSKKLTNRTPLIVTKVEFVPANDSSRRRISEVLNLLLSPNTKQASDTNQQGEENLNKREKPATGS